jgi:hypothetical protein
MRAVTPSCVTGYSVFEPLEPRLLLSSGLWVTGLTPTGGAGHPFATVEVTLSKGVQDATFTADDITVTGPGGPITADTLTRLDANRYSFHLPGTGLATYSLVIGPDIQDTDSVRMDQDHDGTPGEAGQDAYSAKLSADGLSIAAADISYDGWNLVLYGATSTIDGPHTFGSLEVLGGATLGHSAATESQAPSLDLLITDALVVDASSKIDVSGLGYLPGRTQGNLPQEGPTASIGGTYGGVGFDWGWEVYGQPYGDFRNPTEPGAGGAGSAAEGNGAGGGLARLSAATAVIDGAIVAAGGSSTSFFGDHAGSGGGIRLDVGTLGGGGSISADGGNADFSGGGGRVAVYYDALAGFDLSHVTAVGGNLDAEHAASPGTVYLEETGHNGQLVIDNHGAPTGTFTPLGIPSDTEFVAPDVVIRGAGVVVRPDHQMPVRVDNLTLSGGAVLTHRPSETDQVNSLDLSVSDTLSIDAASKIDVSGAGYLGGRTSGNSTVGAATGYSGGTYGGMGCEQVGVTGKTYGDYHDPTEPGAGGGNKDDYLGGAGGGLARISAAAAVIDGAIEATGAYGGGGAGSGGGIWLDVGTLAGAGTISAKGAGDAGGGRVAVYYDTLDGFDLAHVTALGGKGVDWRCGAVGTVYLKQAGQTGELRIESHGAPTGQYTPLGLPFDEEFVEDRLVISGAGVVVVPEHPMLLRLGSLSISDNAIMTHLPTTPLLEQSLRLVVEGAVTIGAGSGIDVSYRGYTPNYTLGNTQEGGAKGVGGGSYGGRGGTGSNATYGDPVYPDELGSGGASNWTGSRLAGGGLVQITAGSLIDDGYILADGGRTSSSDFGGGGGGGGILINVGTLSGSGVVSAKGGYSSSGNGGGGGRVAVYTWVGQNMPVASITASGGSSWWGYESGEDGTVRFPGTGFFWPKSLNGFCHGTELIRWVVMGIDPHTAVSVDLSASRGGQTTALAQGDDVWAGTTWDTPAAEDGAWELRAVFHDSGGEVLGELSRTVLVNNSVYWHSGRITADETWSPDKVHAVEENVTVAAGATLTIESGAVVKFAHHTKLVVEDGATLSAPATADAPIILTSLADDTAGGDSNMDGAASRPSMGDWRGLAADAGATVALTTYVDLRYIILTHSGTLAGSEVWPATCAHYVESALTVPDGVTLTIQPGAVVKFADKVGITVNQGGSLVAEGLAALPIIFTSIRDDSVGGDTNADGTTTVPQAGDWGGITVVGQAALDRVRLRYGGGTPDGAWRGMGAIMVSGGAVTLANSVLADSFFDGVAAGGGSLTATNSVFARHDRAIYVGGSVVTLVNCTLDGNRIGVTVLNRDVNLVNCLITNSSLAGIQGIGVFLTVSHTDVWSPAGSGSTNYLNTPDLTGQNGNLSADPKYRKREAGDYGLQYLSKAIDAGDGAVAPPADFMGVPRYDDPRTPNTGAPAGNDYVDLGAYEFAESAPSNLDLTASAVVGPAEASVGQEATIQWTVTNVGTVVAVGPWHDAVYLALSGMADPSAAWLAGEPVVGEGITLGPGQSFVASAKVVVPPGFAGQNFWEVVTNSRGDLFEGQNRQNNTADSAVPVKVSYTALAVGGPAVVDQFFRSGESKWFTVQPDQAGQDILLSLGLTGSGIGELYMAYGRPVTRTDYDAGPHAFGLSQQKIQITDARLDQPYYVLAYAAAAPGGKIYVLSAAAATFAIDDLSPSAGGNVGNVTIGIRGSEIPADVLPVLIGPDGSKYYGGSLYYVDPTLAYATFDLAGAAEGAYDLRLIAPDGTLAVKAGAFQVSAGNGGRLQARLILPSAVRAGRPYTFEIEYANLGDTDLLSPILRVATDDLRKMGLTPDQSDGVGELVFLGYSSTGPAGILRPGDFERVTVYSTAGTGMVSDAYYHLTSQTVDPLHPRFDKIPWSSLAAKYAVPGGSGNLLWQTFKAQMGYTWDELTAHLDQRLTEQVRSGIPVDPVLDHQMQRAYAQAMDRGGGLTDTERPWILTALPLEGASGGLQEVDLIFSKTIDAATFTAADVVVSTPDGPVDAVVTPLSGRVYAVTFESGGEAVTPKTKGTYRLSIGPDIADPNGWLLDQDRDGATGEVEDDVFVTSFDVSSSKLVTPVLHVVAQGPAGLVDAATGTGLSATPDANPALPGPYDHLGLDRLTIQFSRPVQFLTFTPRDVTMQAPDGSTVPVTAVHQLTSTIWEVDFVRQTALGEYSVKIGTDVQDLDGYNLDQDLDGLSGEGDKDLYAGTFRLVDIHGPRVIAQTPDDYLFEATGSVDIAFSEPIDPSSLTPDDVTLTGPEGPIAVTGISAVDGTTYRIAFDTMPAAGWYQVSVGPDVTDLAGNAMDQDQDGCNGTAADFYAGQVLLAVDPQTNVIIDDPGWVPMMLAKLLAAGNDPVDKIQIKGTVGYGGVLGTFFSVPQVKVELWEVQGTLDKYPGNPAAGDVRDTQITTMNSLTHASHLNDKGEYLFDSTLFGSPLLRLDGSGNSRQFYVVVVAENDFATVYDWAKSELSDPHAPGYKQVDATGKGPQWTPKAIVTSALWGTGADKPGANTEVRTINLTVQSDLLAPLEWIAWGAGQLQRDFGEPPRGKTSVIAPVGVPKNAFYDAGNDVIVLGSYTAKDPAAILHEFGHAIQRSRGGVTTRQAAYGVIQESTEIRQVPGTDSWVEIDPPVYCPEIAYCEAWASFVAAYTLRDMDIWGNKGITDTADQVRSLPQYLNYNNWWMGYDAYGFAYNADAKDQLLNPARLEGRFADPLNGINVDANKGDVVMGAVLSTFWQIARSGPSGPNDLWSAFKASVPLDTDIMDFWAGLVHRPAYMTVFLDNGMTISDDGAPVDDDFEQNDARDAASLLTPMTDFSGNLLGAIRLNGLIMAESQPGAGDWFAFNVTGDQFAVPDQKRNVSIQLDWQERYGDLDIFAQNETTGEIGAAVLERNAEGHELLVFRNLDASEDYHFVVGISGYGAMNPDGTPRDSGGDFVPNYSLTITWGGLPEPTDDDDPGPVPPRGPWPYPDDDDHNKEGGAHDPNAMVGPAGFGTPAYVPAGLPMPYTVFFENSGPQATFPAQEVRITNPLDADLDPATFALTEIAFGSHVITVPAANAHYFHTLYDLRPEQNLVVDIEAGIDPATGRVFCNFLSRDPDTHELPLDPLAGFLPVNDANHSGEGHVSYVIDQASGLPSGRQITNQASIVFDTNPAMDTETVLNTVDAGAPSSQITTPGGSQGASAIRLTWAAQDDVGGSGIASCDVYVSADGGAWTRWLEGATASSVLFTGQPDHTYRFYTVATDNVGNTESAPAAPDATITLWPTEQAVLDSKNKKWSFIDEDGTPVAVSWTGKGTAAVERWKNPANARGNIRAITVDGSDAASGLTIATTGQKVDTAVETILVHGPMGTIAAATTDLLGLMEVQGTLVKATFDEAVGAAVQIGGTATSKPATLVFDQVKDTGIVSAMPLASLTATEWRDTDGVLQEIRAPWIGTLSIAGKATAAPKIAGDFAANLTLSGNGVAAKAKTLGVATVKGGVAPSTWDITGAVGAIKISAGAGMFMQPWVLKNAAGIASLTLGDVADAEVGAGVIGAIKAIRWFSGSITANRLTSIATTGMAAAKMMPAFPGNFGADVTLSGIGVTGTAKALGGATIKGNVTPSTWDITGPVGAVAVSGTVGAAGEAWVLKNSSTVASLTLGDVMDAEVRGAAAIGAVKAVRWQAGSINARTVASIATTGVAATKITPAISGDFKADVTLTGVAPVAGKKQPMTLGSMTAAGWLADMTLGFTGPLGPLTMGGMRNADILAANAADATMSIAGLTIKGATGDKWFINSNVLANKLATVVVSKVETDNSANNPAAFGIKAHTITSYTCDKTKHVAVGNVLDSEGDYTVELLPA